MHIIQWHHCSPSQAKQQGRQLMLLKRVPAFTTAVMNANNIRSQNKRVTIGKVKTAQTRNTMQQRLLKDVMVSVFIL